MPSARKIQRSPAQIAAINETATVVKQTLADAIAACLAGDVAVGNSVKWNERIAGKKVGGNIGVLRDSESAARPVETKGTIIWVGTESLYIETERNKLMLSPNQWGADGTKAGDTAAVQSMIDAGLTLIEFEARPERYKVAGCISLFAPVTFVGKPSVNGDRPVLEASETILTIGSLAGQKVNGFQTFSGFDIRIVADITSGIFDMRSCRNFVFDETVQITSDQQYYIGSVIRSNRSYQFRASCRQFAKGFALVDFGDETGGEVMDNISIRGSINHSNVVIFQRSGISNCHNIDLNNVKVREFAGSDEGEKENCGITYLSAATGAGADSIVVEDAALLKNGALGENDLIYVGSGFDAEYVRVSSVVGNTISLDTPLRFAHSGNHNSSGRGQPVIFGAVFFTFDDVRGLHSDILHIESGFVGIMARNMTGSVFCHIANTCRHMIVNDAGGDGNIVHSVSGGDAGWGEPVSLMTMLECSAQGAFNPWVIMSFPDISADYVTQEDMLGGNIPFWSLLNDEIVEITRSAGTTLIPSHGRKVNVAMTGNSTELSIEPGVFYKQPITISFNQNNQGFRYVSSADSSVNLLKPLKPSMAPFSSDISEFLWNGSAWDEICRSPRNNTDPIFSTSNGSIGTATNTLNTLLKEDGLTIRSNTNGHLYMADGPNPTDPWTSQRDGTQIVPV